MNSIKSSTKIIASTGFISRELYQIRKENNFKKGKDFYMVGGIEEAIEKAEKLSKDNK